MTPNFSAYPFHHLPVVSRREALLQSTVARWLAARGHGGRLSRLVGGPVRVAVGAPGDLDRSAAGCTVRVAGVSLDVYGSAMAVRRIAQRLLGGPDELAAARPLGVVELAIWSLVVATALEDLAIAGEVWPREGQRSEHADRIALAVDAGGIPLAVEVHVPRELALRAPPVQSPPGWAEQAVLSIPIVVGRCALPREALDRLAVRSLVTLEAPHGDAELEILGGVVGVRAAHQAVVAEVATGYVPRDMSLPDDSHVELTVALGTTQLSLRQVFELAIGQVVPLGRPLAGPFELRAAGRIVGRGELVNVEGELAVRVVSLGE